MVMFAFSFKLCGWSFSSKPCTVLYCIATSCNHDRMFTSTASTSFKFQPRSTSTESREAMRGKYEICGIEEKNMIAYFWLQTDFVKIFLCLNVKFSERKPVRTIPVPILNRIWKEHWHQPNQAFRNRGGVKEKEKEEDAPRSLKRSGASYWTDSRKKTAILSCPYKTFRDLRLSLLV